MLRVSDLHTSVKFSTNYIQISRSQVGRRLILDTLPTHCLKDQCGNVQFRKTWFSTVTSSWLQKCVAHTSLHSTGTTLDVGCCTGLLSSVKRFWSPETFTNALGVLPSRPLIISFTRHLLFQDNDLLWQWLALSENVFAFLCYLLSTDGIVAVLSGIPSANCSRNAPGATWGTWLSSWVQYCLTVGVLLAL